MQCWPRFSTSLSTVFVQCLVSGHKESRDFLLLIRFDYYFSKFVERIPGRLKTMHVSTFRLIRLFFLHFEMFLAVMSFAVWSKAGDFKSSTYPQLFPNRLSRRSFAKTAINRGCNMDPWGTPLVTKNSSDFSELIWTYCRWFERFGPKLHNQVSPIFIYSFVQLLKQFPMKFFGKDSTEVQV